MSQRVWLRKMTYYWARFEIVNVCLRGNLQEK